LVGYFGAETFNQEEVLKKCGQHLKIVRDQYRGHLAKNLKYERPPMIPQREWKALLEDGREIALRRQGKLPPGSGRYGILSRMQSYV
jgi:hypothetical protein